jgi:hypothetical protein
VHQAVQIVGEGGDFGPVSHKKCAKSYPAFAGYIGAKTTIPEKYVNKVNFLLAILNVNYDNLYRENDAYLKLGIDNLRNLENRIMSNETLMLFRQGDILIRRITKLPKKMKRAKQAERYILAEGEVTGHHHSVAAVNGLKVFRQDTDSLFLSVTKEPAELKHQEHGSIEIPLGNYEVVRQREYNPNRNRYVLD